MVVAVVFLIVNRDSARWRRLVLYLALFEVTWALLGNTKAPLVGLGVSWYLGRDEARPGSDGATKRRPTLRPGRAIVAIAASVVVVVLFASINLARQSQPDASGLRFAEEVVVRSIDSATTPSRSGALVARTIMIRLDGLQAAAQAMPVDSPRYLSYEESLSRAWAIVIPTLVSGSDSIQSGQLWGRLMTGSESNVSFAEGVAAEGYAIGRVSGLVMWSIVWGACIVGVSLIVARCRLTLTGLAAASTVASAALFERGLLGLLETMSNGLQSGLMCWVMLSLLYRASPPRTKLDPEILFNQGSSRSLKHGAT
ncbi:MAG: hypothetical protein WC869_15685 [Phycisphaerae bacterium]|jgi:hypothetical protein